MALYTIGEVAQLCDINPVTLRAWQRRYGLLKPQRTDGGHRLFNEYEIDRIREIKRWIDSGVQVGKVKTLLMDNEQEVADGWRAQQEILLGYLQTGSYHRLRMWLKERNHSDSAQILVKHLINPLRQRLLSPQPTLLALRGILDGILINHIARSL
ncbi:MAG: MerR family transcriptional regulator, partial [Klebsiella grimontii]|nr:MerR family transcriptional regulator [Klebsiella grimontii]